MNTKCQLTRWLCTVVAFYAFFQIPLCVPASWSAQGPLSGPKANVAFWIGTNTNEILDDATVNFIVNHAGIVVLNAPLKGKEPLYDYASIVKRFHVAKPDLPVLGYTWANRKFEGVRIGGAFLEGYEDMVLRNRRGKPLKQADVSYADVRNRNFRDWFCRRVEGLVTKMSVDGMAFDASVRVPSHRPMPLAAMCKENPGFCKDYGDGMDSLFAEMRRTLSPKLMIYNGLWNTHEGLLKSQEELLRHADGAAIEHFGMHPRDELNAESSFSNDILPFLQVMQSHPSKMFLVFGRGPWEYVDYRSDYMWQRYLYCCYLLGSGTKTFFKYISSFQVPAHEGRSGGIDVYQDWDIKLGKADSPFRQHGGMFVREFNNGEILVLPQGQKSLSYPLVGERFTPEGESLKGHVDVLPGQGIILLKDRPKPVGNLLIDLGNPTPNIVPERSEIVRQSEGKNILRLKRTPKESEWEHDFMLDSLRSLNPGTLLHIRAKTADSNCKILLLAEIDDTQKKHEFAVLEFSGGIRASSQIRMQPGISYRIDKTNASLPWISVPTPLEYSGNWKTYVVDGQNLLGPTGRYAFRRWVQMRIIGDIDIDYVDIRHSEK
jgi:hypothetical protein